MGKFTAKDQIEAVQRYLTGIEGYKNLAKQLGIEPKTFHYWIKKFKYHGEKAFDNTYTPYDKAFKLNVLNYMNDQGTSIRETAAIFNLSTPTVLLTWVKKMNVGGLDALEPKKKGRPFMKKDLNKQSKQVPIEGSIEALEARIKQLEMENDYLKKLNALVQNKKKSPKKTK